MSRSPTVKSERSDAASTVICHRAHPHSASPFGLIAFTLSGQLGALLRLCALPVALACSAAAPVGCGSSPDTTAGDDGGDDPAPVGGLRKAREGLGQSSWVLPAAVKQAGEAQSVPYTRRADVGGGANCTGSFTPAYWNSSKSTFPGVAEVQGYNCRRNTASSNKTSMHGTGRAIDVMIPR